MLQREPGGRELSERGEGGAEPVVPLLWLLQGDVIAIKYSGNS
jgi:hypothetical protein